MGFIQTFPDKLVLIHGLLCLDFTNTVFWRLREKPREGIRDYATFVKWSQKIGILTDAAANRLLQEAETHPVEADIFLNRAIKLREVLYRTITAAVNSSQPRADDLDSLNNEVTLMLQRLLLIQKGDFFEWGWRTEENALDQMLWPILYSATELLTSPKMNRIGVCRGEGCGWLFYDQSRNRTRKWCDMGDCGNRAKARRFYERSCEKRSTNPSVE